MTSSILSAHSFRSRAHCHLIRQTNTDGRVFVFLRRQRIAQEEEDPKGNQKVRVESAVRYLSVQAEDQDDPDVHPIDTDEQVPDRGHGVRAVQHVQDLVGHQGQQAPSPRQGGVLRERAPPTPLRAARAQ